MKARLDNMLYAKAKKTKLKGKNPVFYYTDHLFTVRQTLSKWQWIISTLFISSE